MNSSTILLTGGTGRTGSRVAARLHEQHPEYEIRVASRTARTPFDWAAPDTWDAQLEGADAVYVCYYPDLALPGADQTIAAFAARARVHGISRLVLLSGRGEEAAQRAEQRVIDSGIATTVVRCAFFAQNFAESFLLGPVVRGRIKLPAGDVTEPFVDVEDVCDVITLALTQPTHEGRLYELTGPESLHLGQVAALLSNATGREIRYTSVTSETFAAELAIDGFPAEDALMLAAMFEEVLDGRNSATTQVIEQVLGRPAGTFADYVRRAARTGVWSVPQPAAS